MSPVFFSFKSGKIFQSIIYSCTIKTIYKSSFICFLQRHNSQSTDKLLSKILFRLTFHFSTKVGKKSLIIGHLSYSLGSLSMTVGVITLLLNKMVAMGANYFVWKNIWWIFNCFLRELTRYFEWIITRSLFSILWEILMKICALLAEKIHQKGRAL